MKHYIRDKLCVNYLLPSVVAFLGFLDSYSCMLHICDSDHRTRLCVFDLFLFFMHVVCISGDIF